MKITSTIIFTILFIAVLSVYLFQGKMEKNISDLPIERPLTNFSIDEKVKISELKLEDKKTKKTIVLEGINGNWVMKKPVFYPADILRVDGILMALKAASERKRLRPEKEWGEYGLEEPSLRVGLKTENNKEWQYLYLGDKAPIGDAFFAKWDGDESYFLIPAVMKKSLEKTVYSLREKRIFRMPLKDIRKISIELGSYSFEWIKDDNLWYWMEPIKNMGKKISGENIALILREIKNLYIKEFLDNEKRDKFSLGFFMIKDRIKIESLSGIKEDLYFGNEMPLRSSYYSLLEGEDSLFLVDRGKIFQLIDLLETIKNKESDFPGKDRKRPEALNLNPSFNHLSPTN